MPTPRYYHNREHKEQQKNPTITLIDGYEELIVNGRVLYLFEQTYTRSRCQRQGKTGWIHQNLEGLQILNMLLQDNIPSDISDTSTILKELQIKKSEEDEDRQIYYAILSENTETENFATNSVENEYIDTDNVFYLSYNNDEPEELETLQNKEDSTNTYETESVNMQFLEQVTLPDGTQAYLTRNSNQEDDNLFNSFQINTESEMLLSDLTEEQNIQIQPSESMKELPEEEEDIENNLVFTSTADEEDNEEEYEKIELENGTVAMIQKSLYNKIVEQNRQNEVKNTKEQSASSSSGPSKTFSCPYEGCAKSYGTMHHLRVHLRSHTGTRPYQCTIENCGKNFATGYSLKAHSRTHTGEKPYACVFIDCNKSFKTSGDLQKHNRIHTGEKPFLCPIPGCGRSFTTSNIRKVHIRSHTGERPYLCPEDGCAKAFASATNYKNHVRIHSGEKPYQCRFKDCGKCFTEYSSLYKHQLVHNNSKACKCEYCGRTFRQQSTLVTHKRAVHNIIITENGTEIMVKMLDKSDDEDDVEEVQNEEVVPDPMQFVFLSADLE